MRETKFWFLIFVTSVFQFKRLPKPTKRLFSKQLTMDTAENQRLKLTKLHMIPTRLIHVPSNLSEHGHLHGARPAQGAPDKVSDRQKSCPTFQKTCS